ncbi:MAG: glycosyltransferase [bacterium]
MTLSIIIPAFDEEKKIARDVQEAAGFLAGHELSGEVIVVDDGSSDNTALEARQAALPAGSTCRVIRNEAHRGKGFAVRSGMIASHGDFVMFADSGLTVPYSNALAGLQLLEDNRCEIAHGSRKLPASVIHKKQDWDRKLISRLFHILVIRWLKVPIHLTDTQCGFKIYRGEVARRLFGECTIEGFLFDVEIVLRAIRLSYRIEEFPVEWSCDRDSRISLRRSLTDVLHELFLIKKLFSNR